MDKKEIEHNRTRKNAQIAALKTTLGIVTEACEITGLAPSTHYKWLKEDEEYKKEVEELADLALDFVESKLFETIRGVELPEDKIFNDNGSPMIVPTIKRYPPSDANIRWYLDRKGRKRGYIADVQKDSTDKPESVQPPNITVISEDMSNGNTP